MGQPAARVSDNTQGAPHCHSVHPWSPVPHPVIGPIMVGATTVYVNNLAAARMNDTGVHASAVCCGPNTFQITGGSSTVTIEGMAAARLGDSTLHCSMASGSIIQGSSDTTIG